MTCRICGNSDLVLFYQLGPEDRFKFYKCRNCKLVNLDLKTIEIVKNQQKYADRFKPPQNYEREKGALDAYRFVNKYVPLKGRYLDIGCGSGSVLYFLKKNGWEVAGLELSPVFAEHVKSHLNINVEIADFMEYEGMLHHYDLVSLRHVLEHIPDSVMAMNKISALLKSNGYAHFEFPNVSSLSHRFQRLRNRCNALKKKYPASFVPAHCNEFSRYSFEFLLQKTGFRLIRWETYSFKPVTNLIYNHVHFGTKARAIVQKVN